MRRWRRKLFRGCIAAAVVAVVAAMALPWWLPHVVSWVGPSYGLHVGNWSHDGWAVVEYRDIVYERDGLRVNVGSARLPLLLTWPATGSQPPVVVREITITPTPSVAPKPAGAPPASTRSIAGDVARAWPQIQKWLLPARLEHVTIATETNPIRLERVDWDGTTARITGPIPGRDDACNLTLSVGPGETLHLHADVPTRDAQLDATATIKADSLDVSGALTWSRNSATLTAQFAEGFAPRTATLDAPSLEVPAATIGLAGYEPVRGALHGEWTGAGFVARIDARAAPPAGDAAKPPLAIELSASGDASHARLDSALVRVPGVVATLSAPLEIALPAGTPAGPAAFTVEVDLEKIPWLTATSGKLSGRLDANGGPSVAPGARFALNGREINWRGTTIAAVNLAGDWRPEFLKLERFEVQLAGDSRASATAEVDLAQRKINAAKISAHFASSSAQALMPALPQFEELTLDASASGALDRPLHEGTATWRGLGGVPGGALDGKVAWKGEGFDAVTVEGSTTSAAGVTVPLEAKFARDAATGNFSADVSKLSWTDAKGEWWHLEQPARVELSSAATETPARIRIAGVKLSGAGVAFSADADVRWPLAGDATVEASGFEAARLSAFLPAFADVARVDGLHLHAKWDDGPVSFDGSVRATYVADEAANYWIESAFNSQSDTLALGSLRVVSADGVVLQGEGKLPFTMSGRRDGFHVAVPADGAIDLTLESTPNPKFWESLARVTGWQVSDPQLKAALSGSLRSPRGTVDFTAATVVPPSDPDTAGKFPQFTDFHFILKADDSGLALSEGRVAVDGFWVGLNGQAPWTLWRDWRAGKGLLWRQSTFSFGADQLPMAIGARAMPTVLAADGNVSFSLKHEPGRGFSGFFYLKDAAMRPVAPLGAFRGIGGDLLMDGYKVTLPHLGALLGGRPIDISGTGSMVSADHPEFDLHLVSGHVPLVREQGLVLRAGMDLRVVQGANGPAHISGAVELGQSVLASDLVSLIPTGGEISAPEKRPPYFSVRDEPFAAWTLDVALHGDDFLRIENPFFKGTISADFKLDGTLVEPRLIGRAWSNHGVVTFPFGSMRLDQLELTLSERNPYEPMLIATGSTRIFGYDTHMEASGSASDPRLVFSSDPPLSSQTVFLMLTTGALPDPTHAFSTNERASRLAMFVGRNLATTFGITTGSGDGEERLVVRSGEDFSREGGETIYVQYNLDGRWSLVGERDRFDAYNGGIKFRLIDR